MSDEDRRTIAMMAAIIHARMQGGVKGAAIDAKTAKVLFEQVQKVLAGGDDEGPGHSVDD